MDIAKTELLLIRTRETERSTFGRLLLRDCGTGKIFGEWATIENDWADNAVGDSCIPLGEYPLKYRNFGQYFRAYKKRWGHSWVIEIDQVPDRSAILIHTGNTAEDTSGCVLVGNGSMCDKGSNEEQIVRSRFGYKALYCAIESFLQLTRRAKPDTIRIVKSDYFYEDK